MGIVETDAATARKGFFQRVNRLTIDNAGFGYATKIIGQAVFQLIELVLDFISILTRMSKNLATVSLEKENIVNIQKIFASSLIKNNGRCRCLLQSLLNLLELSIKSSSPDDNLYFR